MNFREYWYAMPKPEREAFAKNAGTTPGYLNLVASNNAKAGEALAIRIERESAGQVRVESLCPNADWAVIRGTADAAPASNQSEAA